MKANGSLAMEFKGQPAPN